MSAPAPTVLPLDSPNASLEIVGGKGHSLTRIAAAGLPVPAGFLLSTYAYKDFVETYGLQPSILAAVAEAAVAEADSVDRASAEIRTLFESASIPSAIAASIVDAYAALGRGEPAVAVRSSATAEDLPGLSFAGQQDTYLNVRGEAALLEAVRDCWASLWTARAITYRQQMAIDQHSVAMGVVVQVMVPAEVSGILFTANPATGDRTEFLINASFGLGEAIVGGEVTPDTYVIDRVTSRTKQTIVGAKEAMIVASGEQGTSRQAVPAAKREEASLAGDVLDELILLGEKVEALFDGVPQDIEWAVNNGVCWLLQSRPITNLPAAPLSDVRWDPPNAKAKLVRRQVVENMPEPLSPLFEDLYLDKGLDGAIEWVMTDLGVPFDIGDFVARPIFVTVNGYGYSRYEISLAKGLWRRIPKVLVWYVRTVPRLLRSIVERWRDEGLPAYLAVIDQWRSVDLAATSDQRLLSGVRTLTTADATYWFYVSMVVGIAKVTDGALHRFLGSKRVKGDLTSGMFLSGFPSKTLQAQIDLEAVAKRIQAVESLREVVVTTTTGELLDALQRDAAGVSILEDLQDYLKRYGHQIYNLDFVQPTQAEDPEPVFVSLKALVTSEGFDTPARRAQLAVERESREHATLASLGPVRRWCFKKLLGWAQRYCPHREEALFYMGAAWPALRRLALELGRRLVEKGALNAPEDVFYLKSEELTAASVAPDPDLKQRAQDRRALREARKRLHPPARVPEDMRIKFGPFDFTNMLATWETQKINAADADTLIGFAVSPGKVTGIASVVLSPADFADMQPDTILVCPTTTPAWTPLFAQASGLVTDIGAILSHGSIVAREYGIPAVLGTGNVTKRIVSGQRITVDGDLGTVTLVE